MPGLWFKYNEQEFFELSLKICSPERLFYLGDDSRYYAYWPKSYKGSKSTLQSRNALIGEFTEKYSLDLLQKFASSQNLYAMQSVVCDELGLTAQSPADIAFCVSKKRFQTAINIKMIFEIKMSLVWNWELKNNKLICLGDFRTHCGNPGLLRSDTMLKAIGKAISIRVLSYKSSHIPIVILGNTPIAKSYHSKVDQLYKSGIVQGFWSLNPSPIDDNGDTLKKTPDNGFIRMDSYDELENNLYKLLSSEEQFLSFMKSKNELGKIIEIANQEPTFEKKAEKFISLIRI